MKPSRSSENRQDTSSEWLQLLVQHALDGIVTMDDCGRIIGFNPAAERIFKYRREQVIGRRVSDMLIPRELRPAHEKGLATFLATGKQKIIGRRIEVTAMRSTGKTFPAELEVISIHPSQAPVFFAYIRDISERKRAAQQRLQYAASIKQTLLQTVLAMSKTVDIRDPYTAGHQRRVAHLSSSIAKSMGLSKKRIEGIFFGALVHDIGKIAVPVEILTRPGTLQEEDILYIQTHCRKGYDILATVDFPWPIAEIALQHHELLDGSGYPQGLRRGEIILEAAIVSVADVIDAITSHRPYRAAIPLREAMAYLLKRAGTCYDPSAAKACITLFENGYRMDASKLEEFDWLLSPP